MTQPDPMNNTIRCPLRARLRMALLALLLVSAGCGAETLNVGDPDAGSTGSTSADGGATSSTDATSGDATTTPSNFTPRDLTAVSDFREVGYVARARPKALELSADGGTLYVALEGNLIDPGREVLALDPQTGTIRQRIEVGAAPQGMALSPDGSRLYVACQFTDALAVIDTTSQSVVGWIPVSFYAQDVAVSANGRSLYVTNRWLDALEVVALSEANGASGAVTAQIPVGTNPRDVVVTEGGLVFVGNLSATSVSVVDPEQGVEVERVHTNSPVNGLAVGDGFVFVATLGVGDGHPKTAGLRDGARYRGDSTASLGFADINNDLVVLNDLTGGLLYRYTSDTAEVSHEDAEGDYAPGQMIVEGALPEQVVVRGSELFVSMSASDQVQRLAINPTTGALTPIRAYDTGINPFEIAVSANGQVIYSADRLGDTVSRIDVVANTRTEFYVGPANVQPYPANEYEVGEMLFHSARFSSEALPSSVFPEGDKSGDKSCNHCHREALTDGKVWTVGPDAIVPLGGERMPPAARNIRDTLPLFWEGVQSERDFDLETNEFSPLDDFEGATEQALEASRDRFFVAQVGLTFDQVARQRIGSFLMGRPRLLPNPNAQYPTPEQAASIERGRQLFLSSEVKCGTCHPDAAPDLPFTTNETIEPVISLSPLDNGYLVQPFEIDGTFNIPSLRGVWDRPRVYFHDGRAKSIRSAILGPGHPALVTGEDGCHLLADEESRFLGGVFRPVYNGQGCNEVDGLGNTHGTTTQLTSAQVDDLIQFVLSIE